MYFYFLWLMPDPCRSHGLHPFAGAAQHRGSVEGDRSARVSGPLVREWDEPGSYIETEVNGDLIPLSPKHREPACDCHARDR